jgi:DNA-binding response OmpR family regulator
MTDNDIPIKNLASGKKRILIVDDDAEIVELMVDVLARDGRFDTKTASSGYDAGLITQQFRPDLMILDYMLPDVNGNIVCQTIRRNPEFANTKIVIVSGVVNQDEIQDLIDAGAEDFMKKPFNIIELVEKIATVLQLQ